MKATRRQFIKTGSISAVGICLGPAVTSGCSPIVYATYEIEEDRIVVSKSEFGEEPYVVIKVEKMRSSVYLGRLDDGNYSALLMECTHKQCTVRPVGTSLTCPCHGSEFNSKGEVLESPAEKNLHQFKTEHDESNVYIF